MYINNFENQVEILNLTQSEALETYHDLTEGELDELFEVFEEDLSNDWSDRVDGLEETEFSGMDWLAEQDLSEAEFEFLMDEF